VHDQRDLDTDVPEPESSGEIHNEQEGNEQNGPDLFADEAERAADRSILGGGWFEDTANGPVAMKVVGREGENRYLVLTEGRLNSNTARARVGPQWSSFGEQFGGVVCHNGGGGPLDPDAFGQAFHRIAAEAGVSPRVRLHDVRHGVATVMLLEGLPTVVASAQPGHSDPGFTARVYQHVTDQLRVQAGEALERALS
jgi:hypothetical protein